jgi:glycine oxidase
MNIAIVGAGIMGRTLALVLANTHFNVVLYEKNSFHRPNNCSAVAAGMLSPYAESLLCLPSLVAIGLAAIEAWRAQIKTLPTPVFFDDTGTLCVAHREERSALHRLQEVLLQHSGAYQVIDHVQDLEPEIDTNLHAGMFLPQEAQISAQMLMHSLGEALIAQGVRIFANYPIKQLKRHDYDWIVDCRGLGAKTHLQGLRGVRGELLHLHAPNVNIKHVVRILNPHYPIYLIPRPNHRYILGATCIEAQDSSPLSVRSALELLSYAYSVHKGFAEARILKTFSHCRPAFDSNLPKIMVNESLGVIHINGLFRHGYLFAPVFANAVMQFLGETSWHELVTPFVTWEDNVNAPSFRFAT